MHLVISRITLLHVTVAVQVNTFFSSIRDIIFPILNSFGWCWTNSIFPFTSFRELLTQRL
jgi:hypothetical protein